MYCIKWRVFWRWLKFKHVRINTQFFINKFWGWAPLICTHTCTSHVHAHSLTCAHMWCTHVHTCVLVHVCVHMLLAPCLSHKTCKNSNRIISLVTTWSVSISSIKLQVSSQQALSLIHSNMLFTSFWHFMINYSNSRGLQWFPNFQ